MYNETWTHSCYHCCCGKNNEYYTTSVCVFVALRYPAQCACTILSSVACSALQYFSTFSHKRHDFRKNVTENKMWALIFSIIFVWNISHSKKKWARYDQKCILVFMWSTLYSCLILMKLGVSRQIFEKPSNMKLDENPSSGSPVVPCGWTDAQTDMKLIAAFRSFANVPKKVTSHKYRVEDFFKMKQDFCGYRTTPTLPYDQPLSCQMITSAL